MENIVLLPLVGVLIFLSQKTTKEAFAKFFIPVLLLFPTYYQTKLVQGIPELSFWSAAFIPILAFWLLKDGASGYKFSLLDLVILLHLLLVFYGQFSNSTYKEAQKVFFNDLLARFFPYLIAKSFFTDHKSRILIVRSLIVVSAVVAVSMIIEFRFFYNALDKPIRNLWPTWVPWEQPMKRYGFKRAFGSFAHPICGGYFFAMVAPIAVWFWKGNYFSKTSAVWGKRIAILTTLGCAVAISRAPFAGLVLAYVLMWFGWAKNKIFVLTIIVSVAGSAAIIFLPEIIAYVSVDRATAETADQRNAAYRKELMDNYMEIVEMKPWFGWGRFTVPVVKKQKSIDNEYLFIALTSGKIPLYAYILTMIWVSFRLLIFVFKQPYSSPEGRLAWCLLGGWFAAIFTQSTVYAGTQTVQMFYIIAGMSEGLVTGKLSSQTQKQNINKSEPKKLIGNGYRFSRVL
ncbi:O-antigen ligase family protein [bacterium]|nr:O-antigen ligase family protein [bacterium]